MRRRKPGAALFLTMLVLAPYAAEAPVCSR
jgi:hypothetical protein